MSVVLTDLFTIQDIIRFILTRLRVNMDIAKQLFGILLKHNHSPEAHWLQPGFTVKVNAQFVYEVLRTLTII